MFLWVRQLALRVFGIASRQDIADMRRALAMLASELRRSTATKYKAQERGLALVLARLQTQNKAQDRGLALVLARLQTQNKAQDRGLALMLARLQRVQAKNKARIQARLARMQTRLERVQTKNKAQIQARLARMQIGIDGINDQLRHVDRNVKSLVRHAYVDQVALPFPHNVLSQRFHVWSQNEEDGITLALINLVGSTTRRFVELGAGKNGGNTGFLAETCGWKGLMVDGSQDNAERLVARFSQFGVVVKGSWITPGNVNLLVRDSGMSGEIDLLSLDIDGNDYWIWQRLDACSPRIVVLEFNPAFGPERAVTVPYDPAFYRPKFKDVRRQFYGASLAAFEQLAREKGYRLVLVEPSRGVNAYFLRNDVGIDIPAVASATIHPDPAMDAQPLFDQIATMGLTLVDLHLPNGTVKATMSADTPTG